MMVGVISDTHGNRGLAHHAAEWLKSEGASLIFHLGDNYSDGEELGFAGYEVRVVPGLWCPEYGSARVPNTLREEVGGITISCAHADKDLRAVERAAAIVLTGHTHRASIEKRGKSIHANPGHLQRPMSRGEAASFASIRWSEGKMRMRIHEVDGSVRLERRFSLEDLA